MTVTPPGWQRSAATALDVGGGPTSTLSAVMAPRDGVDWMIAGTRTTADGSSSATVWSSPDGVRWSATTLPGSDGRAMAATAWGARTLIVGSVGRGVGERAAVWMSQGPGEPFVAVTADTSLLPSSAALTPSDSSPARGSAAMDVVAAGTQGAFAAGSVAGRETVWYSTDGTDWATVAGADEVIGGRPGAVITDLLVTPTAVLASGTAPDGTHTDGEVWSSPNGMRWQRASAAGDPFAGAGDHLVDGLALDSTGSLVAVGGVRSGPSWVPASWVSPDGTTWSQPSEAFPDSTRPQPELGGTVVRAVTSDGTGMVAVGGSTTAQRVWTSNDGLNWTETPLPAGPAGATDWSADLVAASGSTTVVVDDTPGQPRVLAHLGSSWREISAQPTTFGPVAPVATPAALVADGSGLVLAVDVTQPGPAIGATTSSVVVLASSDGTHWRRLNPDSVLSGGWIDSMTRSPEGLVASGYSTAPSGTAAATIWTSATGRRWAATEVVATGAPAPSEASTLGPLGPAVLAAGTDPAADAGVAAAVDTPRVAGAWPVTGSAQAEAGPLDTNATIGTEAVLGACSNGHTLVEVGDTARRGIPTGPVRPTDAPTVTTTTLAASGSPAGPYGQASDGLAAATWTTTGAGWEAGTVSPLSGAGSDEVMDGCAVASPGFVAWGQTPGPGGVPVAALWSSADGVHWTLEQVPTLGGAGAAPLTDVARSGREWIAVGGGLLAAAAQPGDPGATRDDPTPLSPAPLATSGPDGPGAVWASSDAGQTWAEVPTVGAPWAEVATLSTNLVQILGSEVVVAGRADGRATVWVGHAATVSPRS